MCERPAFHEAHEAATRLLLQQNINSLFIDVRNFQFDRQIQIDSVQHYAKIVGRNISDFTCPEFDGSCVIPHPACKIVLYDETQTNEYRKHWGIAHEIGHIYLSHTKDEEKEEKEAHFFAAQLIMPEIVLRNIYDRMGHWDPEEISGTFNASLHSAIKRVNTFVRRMGFSASQEDKLLLAKFMPILDKEYPQIFRNQELWNYLSVS